MQNIHVKIDGEDTNFEMCNKFVCYSPFLFLNPSHQNFYNNCIKAEPLAGKDLNSRWSNVRCKLNSYISTQISSKCKVRNCYFYTVRYIDTRYHMTNVWYQILIPWMTPNKMLGYTKSWFSCMVNTIRYHTTSWDFQTLYFFWTRSKVRCSFFGGFLKWCMPQCNHPPPKARGRQMDQ